MHSLVVATVVALLVSGAVLDVVGAALRRPPLRRVAGRLLVVAGITVIPALFTGSSAASLRAGITPLGDTAVDAHSAAAAGAAWLLLGAAVLRARMGRRLDGAMGWVHLGAAVGAASLGIAVALTGLEVTRG